MMQVIFANNQCFVAGSAAAITITTDPISLNGTDRMTAVFVVHGMFSTTATGLRSQMQVSNDGANWMDYSSPFDMAAAGTDDWVLAGITFKYCRIAFTVQGSGGVGGALFDMNAMFDKAGV